MQWIDPATDLDCLMVRNRCGVWCGYVGVPPSHPWHGTDYGECIRGCGTEFCTDTPGTLVDVHGGLTYAALCQAGAEDGPGVCHVPEPGRPADVWWFGFDTAHCGDLMPSMATPDERRRHETYRDIHYVRAEVASLARQLAEVAS